MRWSRRLVCVACSIALSAGGSAQTSNPVALSIDFARYYFKTPDEEMAARAQLNEALDRMAALKGQVKTAFGLLLLLRNYDDAQRLFAKHAGYLRLRCSLNRKDAACGAKEKIDSEFEAKTAFLAPEILSIPEDRLSAFLKGEPTLEEYRFALADIRRDAPHVLPEPQRALLDRFQPEIADWQNDLYEQIVAGISFGTVTTPAGALDVARQRNLIAASAEEGVREQGFRRRYAGFASQRDLLGFALIHTMQAQTALAQAELYPDAPSRKYESLYLRPAETRSLLSLMAQHGDVVKRYEKILSQDYERNYHQPAHAWDLSAPAPGFSVPITSLPDARNTFHEVFAGLGKEYQVNFDALIDPANGRADILTGGATNRYGGGFSLGFAGSPSILFYGRYDGTFKDLSVIAHEGGHATHRQLMTANGVTSSYSKGPNFLFESFAEFNELLLAEFMAEHANSPELKRYYREQWMNIKGLDAFYGAQDALLEQAMYEGVATGMVRDADALDSLTLKIDGQFSIFPASIPELRTRWATVSLMFEDPLYDVNYMYGGLLALKYYQLYSTKRAWFVPRYISLLKNGFDRPPADLLQKFLGIDLSGPALVKEDLELLDSRLQQLNAGWARK